MSDDLRDKSTCYYDISPYDISPYGDVWSSFVPSAACTGKAELELAFLFPRRTSEDEAYRIIETIAAGQGNWFERTEHGIQINGDRLRANLSATRRVAWLHGKCSPETTFKAEDRNPLDAREDRTTLTLRLLEP